MNSKKKNINKSDVRKTRTTLQEVKPVGIVERCERYIIYWHKFANSGLWHSDDLERAFKIAENLARQNKVYDVCVIDTKESKQYTIKVGGVDYLLKKDKVI